MELDPPPVIPSTAFQGPNFSWPQDDQPRWLNSSASWMPGSLPPPYLELEYDYHFLTRICLLAGLVVMSIIGNTLAITKLVSKRMRKKRTTTLFLHLAVADCLVTIFPMAGQMIWEGVNRKWFGDIVFCKIFKFLQTFSLSSSNYILVAIALDRHRAITRPLSLPGSVSRLLAISWGVSLLPSLPCLQIFTVESRTLDGSLQQQPECVSDFSDWTPGWRKAYFSGVAVMIFFLPLLLFICLYSHICYELWAASMRVIKGGSLASHTGQPSASGASVTGGTEILLPPQEAPCQSLPRQHLLSRARVKTTNLSMAVVLAFILTNLPYIIDEFIRQRIVMKNQCNTLACHVFKAFIGVSMVSNSALNPFIFLLFNSKTKFAQSCTYGCCPLTRRFNTSFSMVRVKFTARGSSNTGHSGTGPLPVITINRAPAGSPAQQPINLASPLLDGCDCRGSNSHNHGCLHCQHCQCDSWKVLVRAKSEFDLVRDMSQDSMS